MKICNRMIRALYISLPLLLGSMAASAQDTDPASTPQDTIVIKGRFTENVTGVITEASTGKPLAGIRVTYKDLSAAITNGDGVFNLSVPNHQVSVTLEGEGF